MTVYEVCRLLGIISYEKRRLDSALVSDMRYDFFNAAPSFPLPHREFSVL